MITIPIWLFVILCVLAGMASIILVLIVIGFFNALLVQHNSVYEDNNERPYLIDDEEEIRVERED